MNPKSDNRLHHVVVFGGGTAGWMSAAALSRFSAGRFGITLVESAEIGIIGVGEATIPTIHWFNQLVGVDLPELFRATKATFKLGVEFVDWGRAGEKYFHPFGRFGAPGDDVPWHHRWARDWLAQGAQPDARFNVEQYALATQLARSNRIALPKSDPRSPLCMLGYAYHFDASLYAQYLRQLSERRGVKRVEGRVVKVERGENGDVTALVTESGTRIEGDLFLDCSGLRAAVIGKELGAGFEDWGNYLPCDRAVAAPCALTSPPEPFTRSTARAAGWQWRIPLQHRMGNGLVYSSHFLSDDEASTFLMSHLDGEALDSTPRLIRFMAGRRSQSWVRNVVAVGLSGGFLEPLESTSIHLIQSAVAKLLSLFPTRSSMPDVASQFNRLMKAEYENVRDFLILHYHSNRRTEPMWQHCANMEVPETLRHRVRLFEESARLALDPEELFREASWFAVLVGQGHLPRDVNPLLESDTHEHNRAQLDQIRKTIESEAQRHPSHEQILARLEADAPKASSAPPVSSMQILGQSESQRWHIHQNYG